MTIFEIIPTLEPNGGAETFITSLCIELAKKEKVILITLFDDYNHLVNKCKANNIEYYSLHKKTKFDILPSIRLNKLIKKFHPDVIHSHLGMLLTFKISMLFSKKIFKNIKIIHTIHDNNVHCTSKNQKILYEFINKNLITPICVGKIPAQTYSKYLNKEIGYVNNGIKVSNFNPNIKMSDRKIDFLCVGRFDPIKNQKYLIDIIKLHSELKNYSFAFLGNGVNFEELKKYSSDLRNVKFYGLVKNTNEFMQNSKILLLPSLSEANPIVINEAIASGMMVISNNVGDISNLLHDYRYKKLIEINDSNSFYESMIEFIKIANDEDCIDNVNQEKINSISIEKTALQYLNIFNN